MAARVRKCVLFRFRGQKMAKTKEYFFSLYFNISIRKREESNLVKKLQANCFFSLCL